MTTSATHVNMQETITNQQSHFGQTAPVLFGRELCDLLDPISPETFMTQYWERKPLFIKGGVEKLEKLFPGGFTSADFYRSVREAERNQANGFRLWAQTLYTTKNERPQDQTYIRADQIEEMVAAGANIAAELPSDARLARLATALKAQLCHPGDITYALTLSPVSNGWPLHVDRSINIGIQCEGRKLFVVSEEPVVDWPRGSIIFTRDGATESFFYDPMPWEQELRIDTSRLMEFEAEPGDVIYWPAGTLHTTRALSDVTLNVNLGLNHETFLNILFRFLMSTLFTNPAWRHLPAIDPAHLRAGQFPVEVKAFFAGRLKELRDYIDALEPDAPEFNREWHKLLADPGARMVSHLFPSSTPQDDQPIEPGDLLRLSRRAPLAHTVIMDQDGEPSFFLYFGDKELSVSGEWTSFLQTLVKQDRFVAGSATEWSEDDHSYPWDITREYLQTLLAQGILERADHAHRQN